MKGRLKFIVPLAILIALGGLYKVVLAKPAATDKPKLTGEVYVLPKEFLLNLADNHFVKMNVALVLNKSQPPPSASGAAPPDGFGPLLQEAAVRDVVTDTVTNSTSHQLIDRRSREAIKQKVLVGIRHRTDVKVDKVLFTDVAVQ
ncbi:MAG: hypothetical protein NVSMB25_20320 [Thermoleophilaceae bacterium]